MANAYGFEALAVLKMGTTWGVAKTCGTGDLVRIIGEAMGGGPEYLPDESAVGRAWRDPGDTGNERWGGTVDLYLRYRGLDRLVALAVGTTSGAPTNQSGVVYSQEFRMVDAPAYFATLCIDMETAIDEYDSCVIQSLTISGTAGERVRVSAEFLARDFSNDSTINTVTTTWADPDATNLEYVMFEDLVAFLETGTTIAEADQIYPSAFSLTINNNLGALYTSRNSPNIDQPLRDGLYDITGSITFPVYGTASGADAAAGEKWEDALLAKTQCALSLQFTGGTIAGAYAKEFFIHLPGIEITGQDKSVTGPGLVGHTINFVATRPVAVPTILNATANYQEPLWIEVQNRESANALT